MRALWFAVLLFAGCLGPVPADPPEPADATMLAWGVDGCAFVIAQVSVERSALAARLPSGFALAPTAPDTLPAERGGTIELDAYACDHVDWGISPMAPAGYGSFYVAVEPPSRLREDHYDAYFVKFDTLVVSARVRAMLAEAGLPVHDGRAAVSWVGQSVTADLAFADGGGFHLTGTAQPPAPLGDPLPFMEFTSLAQGGLARWHARLHDAQIGQGAGIVQLPAGWVRDLVGTDTVPATFIAGTWNLDQADVTFPVSWP